MVKDKELNKLLSRMTKTPAKCIFRKGDKVVLSEIGKQWIKYQKWQLARRKVGITKGFSRRLPWCVTVHWIEGDPPITVEESLAWPFLDFYFEEEVDSDV